MKEICVVVVLLLVLPFSSAYILGYDYTINKTLMKDVLKDIPTEYFDGLDKLYFSDSVCVLNIFHEYFPDGYASSCATGIFEYWDFRLTRIRVALSRYTTQEELQYTLLHELGHLKDLKEGTIYSKTDEEKEVFADSFANNYDGE